MTANIDGAAPPVELAQCSSCGFQFAFPRHHCSRCGGLHITTASVPAEGQIYTYTVVRAHPDPAAHAQTPYAVAYVDLTSGPRVLASLQVNDLSELRIGKVVAVQPGEGGSHFVATAPDSEGLLAVSTTEGGPS